MRKNLLFLAILFSGLMHAQNFPIERLGELKDKKSLSDIVLFNDKFYGLETAAGSKMGWTVTLEKMKMSVKLSAYDKNLNPLKESELENNKEVFGPFNPYLKELNKKLYLLYYKYDSRTGIEVFTALIDPSTLALSEPKKVMTMAQKNVGLFKLMDLYSTNTLQVEQSPDHSKILFFWTASSNVYSYSVTDAAMNVISTGYHEIENVKDFTLSNMFVDNTGDFFVGYQYKKKDVFYPYVLAGTSNGSMRSVEIKPGASQAHDLFIGPGDKDKVKVYGTSSADGYFITGVFSVDMDKKTLAISNIKTKEIPAELVEKFENDWYAKTKKKNYGLHPEVSFENFVMSDGTIIIAGDPVRYQVRAGNAPPSPVVGPTFLTIFKTNGDMIPIRLPKLESMGSTAGDFFAHKWNDKLVLLYTDLESNINTALEKAETTNFTSRKDKVLAAAIIENDGRITRRILHPPTTSSFYFSPWSTSSVNDNTILVGLGKSKVGLTNIKTTYSFYMMKIEE